MGTQKHSTLIYSCTLTHQSGMRKRPPLSGSSRSDRGIGFSKLHSHSLKHHVQLAKALGAGRARMPRASPCRAWTPASAWRTSRPRARSPGFPRPRSAGPGHRRPRQVEVLQAEFRVVDRRGGWVLEVFFEGFSLRGARCLPLREPPSPPKKKVGRCGADEFRCRVRIPFCNDLLDPSI